MTTAIQQPLTRRRYPWLRQAALAIVLIYGAPAAGRAEVRIAGTAAAVRVSTSQDTIADVLSALGAAFKVRCRTAVPLSAAAGATYSGSVRQVIARLLDGYNYLLKVDRESIEVIVLGDSGQAAIPLPAPAPKAAVSSDVVSRWR